MVVVDAPTVDELGEVRAGVDETATWMYTFVDNSKVSRGDMGTKAKIEG